MLRSPVEIPILQMGEDVKYLDYFGLKEEPFSIAPDPQFLYMSERHREALAHLVFGMNNAGGFVLLTGEIGTGKTTICRCLLGQIPEDSEIAYVLNPKLSPLELLETICDELHIAYPRGTTSSKLFIDRINIFLLSAHAAGRRTVLIIDEAQNLAPEVLEQVRLLTNLETDKQKLLQIIMLGQPELQQHLARPDLRQLEQRITARYHLGPLSKQEIQAYLSHRLAVAGVERPLFPAATVNQLYRLSDGVPRLINILCDRALLGAYVKGRNTVSPALLRQAAREVFGDREGGGRRNGRWSSFGILLVLSLAFAALLILLPGQDRAPAPPTQGDSAPSPQAKATEPEQEASSSPPAQKLSDASLLQADPLFSLDQSRQLAYQALFTLWGLDYSAEDGEVRDFADRQGLQLIGARGSLGRLRQLNRPAVLKLIDPEGQEYYVTLLAMTDYSLSLQLGTTTLRVSNAAFNRQWLGEFALLWRPPPGYQGALRAGESVPLVPWLEQQLAKINQRPVRPEQGSYDGLLQREVRQLQVACGLDPDGVVGGYTLICLNDRSGAERPQLVKSER